MVDLGRLTTVDLREVWKLEAQHFSTWLADNITMLGEAIGIELEARQRELPIGAFSLDLLAHDVNRDRVVIIENQLEKTNHDHLGKLITYAAGVKASVIIWISPDFREEHRAAIDWLNENTDETKEFFAIQIEAVRIDDSRPAPNFKLISYPNDWQKTTSTSVYQASDDSARRTFFLNYFSELSSDARAAGFHRAQNASGQHDLVLDRLSAGASIAAAFSRGFLTVGLNIGRLDAAGNRRIFEMLRADSESIERELNMQLQWDFDETRKRQRVWTSITVDRQNEVQLEQSRTWAIDTARKFKTAFEPRLSKALAGPW